MMLQLPDSMLALMWWLPDDGRCVDVPQVRVKTKTGYGGQCPRRPWWPEGPGNRHLLLIWVSHARGSLSWRAIWRSVLKVHRHSSGGHQHASRRRRGLGLITIYISHPEIWWSCKWICLDNKVMQITPWPWIRSGMSHSVTSSPKLGGLICVAIQLWWSCNCVACVLQLVCCNCVTRVLQLVCVAIGMCCVLQLRCGDVVIVWPVCCNWCVAIGMCCNSGVVIVAIELLQMQLRCNCVVIVCSGRCNWELIATDVRVGVDLHTISHQLIRPADAGPSARADQPTPSLPSFVQCSSLCVASRIPVRRARRQWSESQGI
jgi:hypothetical protein